MRTAPTLEELRRAPKILLHDHLDGGLRPATVVELAERAGYVGLPSNDAGALGAWFRDAAAGHRIRVGTLLTAMRHNARSMEIAELAIRFRDVGVVGFDIAGAEAGHPPTRHLDAFEYLQRENAHFTIHAGEAFGLPSIWQAIQWCGADRLGHGVRIIDDITVPEDADLQDLEGKVELGRLAAYVRDRRIPLEMCPSSNLQTGAADSIRS